MPKISQEVKSLRDYFKTQDIYVTPAKGRSMRPLIRPDKDSLVIEAVTSKTRLERGDIILYPAPDGSKLILHRLHRTYGKLLKVNGDNCDFWEEVERDQVMGRLVTFYRGKQEVKLSGWLYTLYLNFWIYPWKLRFWVKRTYRQAKKIIKASQEN